ncbi:MAG: V8-like Glu-specific endopeptidase [Bacteriovoracaceae bacterium]
MKTALFTLLFLSFSSFAAVTGEDDRLSFQELEKRNPALLAKATATQLSGRYLKEVGDQYHYPTGKLQNQCPGEKFSTDPTLGGCSGFLIGSKTLVAAGHCKDYQANGCDEDAWLFNHFSQADKDKQVIKKSNLYRCKKVLDFKHDGEGDFVVIELDRDVLGVTPLELDLKNEGKSGDPVAVLGYPLGRSFTYTPGGKILSKDKDYLRVDSDAFKNNSGSALFNIRTGKVEGVLTNARRGVSLNSLDGCTLTKSYKENIVLVNRLSRIGYLKKNFSFKDPKFDKKIINQCPHKVSIVSKYRQAVTSEWVTNVVQIMPNQSININDMKSDLIYLHIKNSLGKTIMKGKDFYGFIDKNREVELGFKEVSLSQDLLLCQ